MLRRSAKNRPSHSNFPTGNGEAVALEVTPPFGRRFGEHIPKEYPELFTIDSLSMFINFFLFVARSADRAGGTFVNDWARTIGKPRRIIADSVGPSLTWDFRRELSRAYGRQMIHAPQFTHQQNGLAERVVRPFSNSTRNIFGAVENPRPCRGIPTQSVVAKNHVPHSTTEMPTALETTGRFAILSGYSADAFNRDPEIADSVIEIQNYIRGITNARYAAIYAEANRPARTMFLRKAPDRSPGHFLPGRPSKSP